jgi:hypothetical protein
LFFLNLLNCFLDWMVFGFIFIFNDFFSSDISKAFCLFFFQLCTFHFNSF